MQFYEVELQIPLGDDKEITTVVVCAANADQAALTACVHAKIAPSMAGIDVRRIKGNAMTVRTKVVANPQQAAQLAKLPAVVAKGPPETRAALQQAHVVQASAEHRPRLVRRIVEFRASTWARSDDTALIHVGKAIERRGKIGAWRSEFVELEDLKVGEDEPRKPNNPRAVTNGQYVGARVFKN